MALNPNVVVVAPNDLITSDHLNRVRSNLDRLDTTKVGTTGNWTMTGSLQSTQLVSTGEVVATTQNRAGGDPNAAAVGAVVMASGQFVSQVNAAAPTLLLNRPIAAAGQNFAEFRRAAAVIGSISQVGTTGVAYNATSDYRLKDDLGPIVDPLGRILALRPIRFAWKADGTEQDGFFAHEVSPVAPYAVTGEKDAVFSDDPTDPGQIVPQQLDNSKLIPLLVAAVQALTGEVAELRSRLDDIS